VLFVLKLLIYTDFETYYHKIPWDDSTGIEREIKKFKDIFSKSVYSDLLSRIDGANGALKTLMDQSRHHEESRRTRRGSNISLLKYKSIRKHAANLYNTVTQGKYWNCPCKNSHCVHLRIEPQSIGTNDDHRTNPVQFKLRMAFSSMSANKSTAPSWHWHEVETIPAVSETQDAPSKFPSTVTAVPRPTAPRKVQFAIVTSSLQSLPWPEVQDLPPALSISDMCLALRSVNTTSKPKEYIGTISDGADTTRRYNFYLVGKIDGGVETQSLEDLLSSSSSSIIIPAGHGNRTLSRRDRLFLAATLASSVLQFHGTWLKSQWDSRDILFAKSQIGSKTVVEHLYLSGHKVHMPQESTRFPKTTEATKSLIRSQALFPLGITLVELSLGQPISALWVPENNEPVNAVTSYIIGSQQLDSLLDNVYGESGGHYGDVVKKCLYWSDTRNVGFEDDGFQRIFFNTVVLPLVEDLRTFEGNARHY